MNIDRHNYEECFVLYWDNELTAEQKRLVETFVQQNADLQEEFRLFGETRFVPEENISLKNKELLTIDEHAFINLSNYSGHLLSYVDNELTAEQRIAVEKFSTGYSFAQQELAVLQKTKLQPEEEIVFPDKSSLYRKEEKVRVVRMIWWRAAVAAAIIIVAGLVTVRVINTGKQDQEPGFVSEKDNNNPESKQADNTQQTNVATREDKLPVIQSPDDKTPGKPLIENAAPGNSVALVKTKNGNNLPKEKRNADQPLIAKTNIPEEVITETELPGSRKASNDAVAKYDSQKAEKLFDGNTVTSEPRFAYNIITDDGPPEKDKGGLKGFLRKATRVFERRTKIQTTTDDNKLLVGVFAVSLK